MWRHQNVVVCARHGHGERIRAVAAKVARAYCSAHRESLVVVEHGNGLRRALLVLDSVRIVRVAVWRYILGYADQLETVIAFCEQVLARSPPTRRAGHHKRLRAVAAKLTRAYCSAHGEGHVLEGARKLRGIGYLFLFLRRIEAGSLAQLVDWYMGERVGEVSRLVPLCLEEGMCRHGLGGCAHGPVATDGRCRGTGRGIGCLLFLCLVLFHFLHHCAHFSLMVFTKDTGRSSNCRFGRHVARHSRCVVWHLNRLRLLSICKVRSPHARLVGLHVEEVRFLYVSNIAAVEKPADLLHGLSA